MKNKIYIVSGLLSLSMVLFSACGSKKATETAEKTTKPTDGLVETPAPATESICNSMDVTYENTVKSIMDVNCANSCHSAEKHASGIDLSTHEKVKEAAAKRYFMGSLNHQVGFAAMPLKAPKLSNEDLEKLQCWIENGMK
jgi:hypothetical protein